MTQPDAALVEAVARAICKERYAQQELALPWWGDRPDQPPGSVLVPSYDREMYRSFARAIIPIVAEACAKFSREWWDRDTGDESIDDAIRNQFTGGEDG